MRFCHSRTVVLIAAVLCITLVASIVRAVYPLGSNDEPASLLGQVHARFDPMFPGKGVADYPGNTVVDIPKSYAMILIAELERRRHGIEPELPDLTETAGRWLLDNASLNSVGTIGWGVPVDWDAYGDESENPANTIYSISTAIVADALMSWMETDPDAPGERILSTLSAAFEAFVRAPRTPSGLLPYSLEAADAPYDTFNSAAYLAGQMQRFAKYVPEEEQASQLRSAADATVAALIEHHNTSASGAWYWAYSVQEAAPNDLPHASYIIDGLRTYVREQGRLADQVDMAATLAHLGDFFDTQGRPRAWPVFREEIADRPRLYDLGMALTLACSEPSIANLAEPLLNTVPSYRSEDGRFHKLPVPVEEPDPAPLSLVVNEYEAYLWRGLVSCESRKQADARATIREIGGISRGAEAAQGTGAVSFVRIGEPGVPVGFDARAGRSDFVLPWAPSRRVAVDGIASQILNDGAGGSVIVRGFPANDLALVALDEAAKPLGRFAISQSAGSAPMLRAVAFHAGLLHIVYYDNPTLGNYLARYRREAGSYVAMGEPMRLPSLEDPAGGTYEMIPAVFLLPEGPDLHVVGGTLDARIDPGGRLTEARISNCSRVLEAVATPWGPVSLCVQAREAGGSAPFELHGPSGLRLPNLVGQRGIPYDLRFSAGSVRLSFADSPAGYASMLAFDLERTNAGWLEFGTDNIEGRIPWSQIYYLNGFLDFLALADEGSAAWSGFAPVLQQMRSRLDDEIAIADRHWREGRYATRAFTVDRSLALFAVQTSRLLLVMDRYLREVGGPVDLPGYDDLRTAMSGLRDHIEVLADEGQEPHWLPPGTPYLKWPKQSGFYFDGLNVPFNHQNEWAYALVRTGGDAEEGLISTSRSIVGHFLRRIAPDGRLPLTSNWDYWWGKAYDGWAPDEGVLANKPEYSGDHGDAWISFRSIDTMSALTASSLFAPAVETNLRKSAAALVAEGKLYPFVAYELRRAGLEVDLPAPVARRYLRVSSPWELQSAAWAYAAQLRRVASGEN